MSIFKKSLLCLATMSVIIASAQIEDNPSDSDIVDLESYTVVSSRIALPTGTVGASVTKLTTEDTNRFMAEMVTESLRYVPGVYLRNNGSIGSSAGISMRGLPIAPVVLIDGVEVNNPGNGGIFNFGTLPVVMVESIEVLRGAQSALYGANALTGVISITTKKGETIDPAMAAGISYGSRNSLYSYLTLSQAKEKMNYFITASYAETDGYSAQNVEWGPEWADDDSSRNSSLMGKIEFELSDKLDLFLFASYLDGKSEFDPGSPSPWTIPVADNYTETEQLIMKSQLGFHPVERLNMSAAVSYNKANNYSVDSYGILDSESDLLKFELINQLMVNESYQIVAGAELEKAADNIGDYEMETISAFLENIFEPVEDLYLTAAIRFDDNNTFGSDTTLRTSFSYLIDSLNLQLKGSYGTSYDAPEISELFGTWGNPDLVPEEGSSYDLGFEQELIEGKLVWGVNYFCVKIEDSIEYLRSTSTYANVDWESCGFETFVRYAVSEDFNVKIAHSFANAERKRVEDSLIFHSPEHQFSLLLDKGFLEDKWNFALSVLYIGDRETWDGATDSFVTVDLAGRFQYSESLEIWLRFDNLLDEEYQEIRGYNSPRFGVFGGIKFEF